MDPLLIKVVTGVITVLVGTIGILWKEMHKWQRLAFSERQKRREESSQHSQTSEMFLSALRKLQRSSSDPPSSSH